MLVSALVATLVGFGFLVVALVTGTLWLAVACIVVCVLGALLLVADTLGLGRPLSDRLSRAVAAVRAGRARRGDADDPQADPADIETAEAVAPHPEISTETTTEMPRVETQPVADLVVNDAVVGGVSRHHGRHETPDDVAVDTHAHVRRDGEPLVPAPWLGATSATPHARPDDEPREDPQAHRHRTVD